MLSSPIGNFGFSIFVTMLCSEFILVSMVLNTLSGDLVLSGFRAWLVTEVFHILYLYVGEGVAIFSKQFARRGRAVDIEGSGLDDLSAGARPRHDGAFLLSLLFLSSGLRVFLNFRRGFDNFLGQLEDLWLLGLQLEIRATLGTCLRMAYSLQRSP